MPRVSHASARPAGHRTHPAPAARAASRSLISSFAFCRGREVRAAARDNDHGHSSRGSSGSPGPSERPLPPARGPKGGSAAFRRRNLAARRERPADSDDPWHDPSPEDIDAALVRRNSYIKRPFPHQRWQPGDPTGLRGDEKWLQEPEPPMPPSKPNAMTNFVNAGARLLTDLFPEAPIDRPPPPPPPPPRRRTPPPEARPGRPTAKSRDDWASEFELGDEWAYRPDGRQPPPEYIVDTRPRYPNTNTPEDKYLRPFNDSLNPFQYITWDRVGAQKRYRAHMVLNQRETRSAVNFLVIWVIVFPLAIGYCISRGVANPIMAHIQDTQPESFPLTKRARAHGVDELREETYRVRFEAQVGRAPPLAEGELYEHLVHFTEHYKEEMRDEKRVGRMHLVSDTISLTVAGIVLRTRREGFILLRNLTGRVSKGLSQTAKAFMLILIADILMGYHSEEAWTSSIELITEHYSLEPEAASVAIFVSIIPVGMDTWFKYWVFTGLQRIDPAAAVTMDEIDRH